MDVRTLLIQTAQKYGVSPAAVLADAMGEGGIRFGAVGDHGTSFGPFQLHIGGASPYSNPSQAAAFANSPAGVDYAIRQMAQVAGHGNDQSQLNNIVARFERPADIPGAISLRSQYLPQFAGIGAGSSNGRRPGSDPGSVGSSPAPAAIPQPAPAAAQGANPAVLRQVIANMFLQGAGNTINSGQIDTSSLAGLALARQALTAAMQPVRSSTPTPAPSGRGVAPAPAGSPHLTSAPGTSFSGYSSPLPAGAPIGRVDQGVDYSKPFHGNLNALGSGKVYAVTPFAVYYSLDHPVTVNGRTYHNIYAGESGQPLVKPGQRINAGEPIAFTKSGWQESGFAAGDSANPVASPLAPIVGGLGAGTQPTQPGQDFLALLKILGG